ncbi:unnamed protein product [Echinostoma caproni]|uniref:WH2 domain-containing protein n=1 Tax=Echinostoma caproni TaxID=27848 RepID=A0A183B4A0_9TREM|nr:unnamed protein product [Echinostoma caproni]
MSQAPGYGWCMDASGQAGFPGPAPGPGFNQQPCFPVGQTFYPNTNQPPNRFIDPPNMTPGFGWQQGPGFTPNMGFGGFNSAPMHPGPSGPPPGAYGFGFSAPPVQPMAPSPPGPSAPAPEPKSPSRPSAPPSTPVANPTQPVTQRRSPVPGSYDFRPSFERQTPTDSGSKVINITSDPKPERPPPPKVVPAANPTPKSSSSEYHGV